MAPCEGLYDCNKGKIREPDFGDGEILDSTKLQHKIKKFKIKIKIKINDVCKNIQRSSIIIATTGDNRIVICQVKQLLPEHMNSGHLYTEEFYFKMK